jgi:uncharacterized protein (DUF1499 family)
MWSKWTLLALVVIVILVPIVGLYVMSLLAGRPAHLGVKQGKLAPCPAAPNCVSTQAEDSEHRIDPIRFTGNAADALAKLKQAFGTLPRAAIVTESADYLHVECTSLIFRFTDDVECWIDEPNQVIHFRSASRVGRSDFGVNRKRMEAIRKVFAAPLAA